MEKPIELKSYRKGYTLDQDKVIHPEETVKRAMARIEAYGAPLIGSFHKLPSYFDMDMYRIDSSRYVLEKFPQFSGSNGKGALDEQARASCVMEFIERFSSNSYGGWEKFRYSDIPPGEAITLESIADTMNCLGPQREEILKELGAVPLYWSRAYNFKKKKYVYVPKLFFEAVTTGLASGNTLEEALLQAVCECVERHCGACVQWYRHEYPTIDRASVKSPLNLGLLDKLERRGIEVIIKDFSGILGIPTIGVILLDREYTDSIGKSIGVACDKDKALARALTESVQGIRERSREMFNNRSSSFYFKTRKEAEFLLNGPLVDFADVIDISGDDIKEEAERCIKILSAKGREVMCVDMTEAKLDVPVVWIYLNGAFLVYEPRPLLFYLTAAHLSNDAHEKIPADIERINAAGFKDAELDFLFGLYHQKNGNFREAVKYFEAALCLRTGIELRTGLEKYGDRRIIMFHIGSCLLWLKEYGNAIKYLQGAESLGEKTASVYGNLAVAYQRQKQFEEAAGYYEKAVALAGGEKWAWELNFNAGLCYMELRRYDRALEKLEKAKSLSGDNSDIRYQLGICYQRVGNFSEAINNYAESLALDTVNHLDVAMVSFHIGECYLGIREYDEAIKHLEKAKSKEEDRGVVYLKLGLCYEGKGNYREAVRMCDEALKFSTDDVRTQAVTYSQRGRNYVALEGYALALESFLMSKELNPEDGITYLNLGVCYKKLGKYREAQKCLVEASKFGKTLGAEKEGEIYFHLALCHAALEEHTEAVTIFNFATPNVREKKDLYFHIGLCRFKQGNYNEAIQEFTKSLGSEASGGITDINVLFYLGLSHNMLNEYVKAMEIFQRAVKEGGRGMIKYHMGMAYRGLGRHKEAVTNFEEAFGEVFDGEMRSEVKYQIGQSRGDTGDRPGAKAALKEAIEHDPKRVEPYNLLGMMCIEDSENDAAIAALEQGIKVSPRDWTNYNLLGVSYRNKGDMPSAIKYLEKAILLNQKEWSNYNILGKIYMDAKAYAQALYMYEKALAFCPDEKLKAGIREKIRLNEERLLAAGLQKRREN